MLFRRSIPWLLPACVSLAWCVAAAGSPPLVEVTYADPERFTDVRDGYTQTPLRSTGYPTLPGVYPSDPLLYEKALLADWLREDVVRRAR